VIYEKNIYIDLEKMNCKHNVVETNIKLTEHNCMHKVFSFCLSMKNNSDS
jgi:hypothetical protein